MIKLDIDFPNEEEITPDGPRVDVVVGGMTPERQEKELTKPVPISMNIRKTLGGDLIIRDHKEIYIVVKVKDSKIIVFPRELNTEITQKIQKEFFDFMVLNGLIDVEDIEGGDGYGTMQSVFAAEKIGTQSPLQMVLYGISKWLEEVRPAQEFNTQFFHNQVDSLTKPKDDETTDPEAIAKMEQETGLDNAIRSFTYNLYAGFPYWGLYYL